MILPLSLRYLVASCGHGCCCFFSDCFFECDDFDAVKHPDNIGARKLQAFWTTWALVFCKHVFAKWRLRDKEPTLPWNSIFATFYGWMGVFFWNHCEHGPPIVWFKLRAWVWLLIWWHLLDLLCWRVRGGDIKMEKWIGSWGLSKKHGKPKIVVTPQGSFFWGYTWCTFFIIYHYLAAENHSPIFFCEEGSGKYGWL